MEYGGVLLVAAAATIVGCGCWCGHSGDRDVSAVPVHPSHAGRAARAFNITLLAIWGVLALITLARNMAPGSWITGALCAIAVYVIGAGVLRRPQ